MPWLLIAASLFCVSLLTAIGVTASMGGGKGDLAETPVVTSTPEAPKCVPCVKPDPQGSESGKPNKVPNVTDLTMSKTEMQLPCSEESAKARDTAVEVTTTAEDADGDVLTYVYTVTGGRVVGVGKNVHWNFLGIKPGTYEIIAGVDDGCGVCGRTEKKTVSVLECSSAVDGSGVLH